MSEWSEDFHKRDLKELETNDFKINHFLDDIGDYYEVIFIDYKNRKTLNLKYYDEYTTPRSKEDVQNIINLFKDRIKLKTE